MTGKFAYSFDRDQFTGAFETRNQALAAAQKVLSERSDIPEGIYVGQWTEPDPQADLHAEAVLEAMRDRYSRLNEDRTFLRNVTEQQQADLDHMLDATIRTWMNKHNLQPRASRVHAISEHPLPNVHHVPQLSNVRETSLMGEA